jgi:uncharacterized membrane protein YfcA
LSLLSQGKFFIHFTKCDPIYWISISAFIIIYALYILLIKYYLKQKVQFYKEVGYKYSVKLGTNTIFLMIFLGGFLGGFMEGLVGVGSGHCMVGILVYIGLSQRIASATAGYQVFFVGLSSLIQAKADGRITYQ